MGLISFVGRLSCRIGFHSIAIAFEGDRSYLVCVRCGHSTRRELAYARSHGKVIRFLEPNSAATSAPAGGAGAATAGGGPTP